MTTEGSQPLSRAPAYAGTLLFDHARRLHRAIRLEDPPGSVVAQAVYDLAVADLAGTATPEQVRDELEGVAFLTRYLDHAHRDRPRDRRGRR